MKSVQKEISKYSSLKKQKFIHPKSSPLQNLGRNPSPFKFYTNVLVYNFDPKELYPSLNIEYECIYCGSKKVICKGKRFRPAFSGSKIDWILYDRLQCNSACCKGGKGRNRIFGTIDPMFINKIPHPVADDFSYLFPNRGPGIKLDMVKILSLFTDKHVLFSAFAKAVNDLQWEHYYRNNNAYYHILNDWLRAWPPVSDYNNNVPLCSFGYNGSPILPYSAFGESGYHHRIPMTKNHAETLFS